MPNLDAPAYQNLTLRRATAAALLDELPGLTDEWSNNDLDSFVTDLLDAHTGGPLAMADILRNAGAADSDDAWTIAGRIHGAILDAALTLRNDA